MSRSPQVVPAGKTVDYVLVNDQNTAPAVSMLSADAGPDTIQRFVDGVDTRFLSALMSAITERLKRE